MDELVTSLALTISRRWRKIFSARRSYFFFQGVSLILVFPKPDLDFFTEWGDSFFFAQAWPFPNYSELRACLCAKAFFLCPMEDTLHVFSMKSLFVHRPDSDLEKLPAQIP